MAEKKEILLEVKTNFAEAAQEIAHYNTEIGKLKDQQKELTSQLSDLRKAHQEDTQEYKNKAEQLATNVETQKAYRKEIAEVSRGVQNSIISEGKYRDTLKGLCAELSIAKDELRKTKMAGGELSEEYKRQLERVSQLNQKVSTLEQAYGVYTRNVGNYKSGVQELNEQLRQHLAKLEQLPQGSKEWEKERQKVEQLTGDINKLNKDQSTFFEKAKKNWAAMAAGITAVVAAVVGLIKGFAKMIKTSMEFEQAQKNLQTILGLNNEQMQVMTESAKNLGRTTEYTASQVTDLQIALAKLGFTAQQIRDMSGAVLALATDLDAGLGEAADLAGSVLRQFGLQAEDTAHIVDVLVKGANESALSFDKYRTALAQVAPVANAMGFDLEGVVSILGALVNVGMDASMAATSTRNILLKMADANSDLAKSLSQPVRDIPTLVAGLKELQGRGLDVAAALELTDKRSVAAFSSLLKNADAVQELNEKLQDVDGYAIGIREERLKTTAGSIKMLQSAWEGFELAVMKSEGGLARVLLSLAESINEITDKLDPEGKLRRDFDELTDTYIKDYEAIAEAAEKNGADVNKTLKSMYDTEVAAMQERANEQQRIIKSANHQLTQDLSRAERKRLENMKAQSEAEIAEIKRRYRALKLAYTQVSSNQQGTITEPTGLGGGGSEEEDKKAQKRREKALKEQENAIKSYFKAVEKLYDQSSMLKGADKEIAEVKKKYREGTAEIAQQVKAGTMTFEEAVYLRVALANKASADIKEIQEKDRKDKEKKEKETLEKEAKARKDQLDTDLQIAWNNADEQFRIKKNYLEKELQMAGISAERKAELEQQLTELMRSQTQQRIDMAMEYANQMASALGSANEILNNQSQQRIQDAEAENEAEKQSLEKRLKAGLVSQKQYDDKVAKMDSDLAAKKAEETQKQARRDKALALFQAAINTASAIIKVWTDVPTMIAPVFTAIVAGVGALQTAAIMSQPLPKAAKGGRIKGATHEQGGVLLETENEERIVAANPAKAFPELLNLISYIGKNAGVANTGFAQRYEMREAAGNNVEIDYDRLIEGIGNKVAEGVSNLQIWLSLTELNDAQRNVARLDELAKQ